MVHLWGTNLLFLLLVPVVPSLRKAVREGEGERELPGEDSHYTAG